jgi:hypothetical protein
MPEGVGSLVIRAAVVLPFVPPLLPSPYWHLKDIDYGI